MRDPDADLKLCEAATPGPWYAFNDDDRMHSNVYGVATSPTPWPGDPGEEGKIIAVTLDNGLDPFRVSVADQNWDANADLIAMAREALPWYITRYKLMREGLAYIAQSEPHDAWQPEFAKRALAEVDKDAPTG